MVDHDDEIDDGDNDGIDDGDNDERLSVDPVAAALALTDLLAEFSKAYKLVTTDKAKAARLRALARLDRRAVAAEQKFAAITAQAEQVQAALDARAAALDEGQRTLEAREAAFASSLADARDELREYHNHLEQTHRQLIHRIMSTAGILGEWSSDLRSPPTWEQLRRLVAGLPDDPPPPERDIASHPRIDASDTFFDPRADRHGNAFLGTLSRDISHKGAQ